MWVFLSILSAFFAALVAIFAKLGLKNIDATLATTIRTIIMVVILLPTCFVLKKFEGFSIASFNSKERILIIFASIAGALSWLCYFVAMKDGPASVVAAIDRLSIVLVVVLAGIFLGESLGIKTILGTLFMIVGVVLISVG